MANQRVEHTITCYLCGHGKTSRNIHHVSPHVDNNMPHRNYSEICCEYNENDVYDIFVTSARTIIDTSRVPVEGKSSVCVICMKYRIINLIIMIINLGQILLS